MHSRTANDMPCIDKQQFNTFSYFSWYTIFYSFKQRQHKLNVFGCIKWCHIWFTLGCIFFIDEFCIFFLYSRAIERSEERRVGKECSCRWAALQRERTFPDNHDVE